MGGLCSRSYISETHIDEVNFYCLIEIFSHLSVEELLKAERVCAKWFDVSQIAWRKFRKLKFDEKFRLSDGSEVSIEFFEEVLWRCGFHLINLRIERIDSFHMLRVISNYCSNLTTIYLEFQGIMYCYVRDARAFSRLEKIKSFTLINAETRFSIECLRFLPSTVEFVQLLPCRYRVLPADSPNLRIFSRFVALDSLEMSRCTLNRAMMRSLSYKQTITKLTLSFCDTVGIYYILDLKNLEYLDLSGGNVFDRLLVEFPEHFPKLKYLDLSDVERVSDLGIRELIPLYSLEELHINYMETYVTDSSIGELRGIKKLYCRGCDEVRDPGIMRLIEYCPDLQELDLRSTSITATTLRFAINWTRNRTNSVILKIIADLDRLNFDVENEGHSPFLIIEQSEIYS